MSVATSITIRDRATAVLNRVTGAYNRMERATRVVNANVREMERARDYGSSHIQAAAERADQLRRKQEEVERGGERIAATWGRVRQMMAGVGLALVLRNTIQLADTMSQTSARLDLINDGLQTTVRLQDKIFASANRSRAAYTDVAQTVAKLGVLAGEAFADNDEIIRFAELMNKNFVVGGSSQQEQTAAMYQLTQAMAAGKLQGDEFRSIMENAPMLAQAIADFTGKSKGELRGMSSAGTITADVIKGAMFASADEIERKFAQMPMTFAQVGTVAQNVLLRTFMPAIQAVGCGAQWLYDNWDKVTPALAGVAAVLVFAGATAVWTTVTWLQVAANRALLASMAANPILWVALEIGVVVGLIYKWVQSVGGLRVAWLIVCDAILTAWDRVKIGFFTGVNYVMTLWNKLQLGFMAASANIKNFMGDMKAGVLTLLQTMVNGAIGIINRFIETVNRIPDVNIGLIEEVSFGTTAQFENTASKQARGQALADYQAEMESEIAKRDADLARMTADAENGRRWRRMGI